MQIGSLGGNLDVAEIVLATFGLFFAGLVVYIQRESNREGWPLIDDNGQRINSSGIFGIPKPKSYLLPSGKVVLMPHLDSLEPLPGGVRAAFTGGPIDPPGNKMLSGLGAAAYCKRLDTPDLIFYDGSARIVPLRVDPAYTVAAEGPDPRGFAVSGADRVVVGRVVEIWVDRSETVARYLEIALSPAFSGRHVLAPVPAVDVKDDGRVLVESILSAQFADVPGTKSLDEITALEEDMIGAYYAGGTLYATPERSEPLL